MKKLMLKLDGKEMLSKEQMKKINGGGCTAICIYDDQYGDPEFPVANCDQAHLLLEICYYGWGEWPAQAGCTCS